MLGGGAPMGAPLSNDPLASLGLGGDPVPQVQFNPTSDCDGEKF